MRTKMPKIESGLLERTVISGLLLREEFRRMLLSTDYSRDYFIDDDTYVDIPESVGVFRSGMNWTVYETDERGHAILKRKHANPAEAFRDAASRRKLSFTPSEVAQSVLHDSLSKEQLSKQLRAVRLAIQNLEKVDQLMCLTENPDAVKEDILILKTEESRLEASLRSKENEPKLADLIKDIMNSLTIVRGDKAIAQFGFLLRYYRTQESEILEYLYKIAMETDDPVIKQQMFQTIVEITKKWESDTRTDMSVQTSTQNKREVAFAFEEQVL